MKSLVRFVWTLGVGLCLGSIAMADLLSHHNAESLQAQYKSVKKIGVFIGTFDPLHSAHEELVEYVLMKKWVDLVVIGANDNIPHKPNASNWAIRNSFLEVTYKIRNDVLVANKTDFVFPMIANNVQWLRDVLPQVQVFGIFGNDIATLPHLAVDLPKIIKENGGRIDAWLVNNSRPLLSKSASFPKILDGKPVLVFSTGADLSSSDLRKNMSTLGGVDTAKYTGNLSMGVAEIIDQHGLYGVPRSCQWFLQL